MFPIIYIPYTERYDKHKAKHMKIFRNSIMDMCRRIAFNAYMCLAYKQKRRLL